MGKLDGKVAVITGASLGIGLATAKLFVAEGAFVYITGRRQPALDAAASQMGGRAIAVRGDISHLEDLDRLYTTVKEHHGKIDILFANASINGAYRPLGMITEEDFDKVFDIDVKGTLFTIQKALPLLQDGGSIVLAASLAAATGAASMSVYNAAKSAVRSFARTWSVDLQARKIRVNAVSPGTVQTPGLDGVVPDNMKEVVAAHALMKRIGEPDELARAVLFLASDESSYITGIDLHVDGGATILH